MAIGRHVRQGDVVLIEVPSSMIEGLRRRESRVIAYGEATGHWHDVEGSDVAVLDAPANCSLKTGLGDMPVASFIHAKEDFSLVHHGSPGDQHGAIPVTETIPGKTYAVVIQREYDPIAVNRERKVVD